MEINFNQQPLMYTANLADQVVSREETMEVRLSDGMPAIGRVLGCWGQTVIRGKEWRGDAMSVSGGVEARILYEPEDGTGVQCVEAWVPFQHKWQFPQTDRDGFICAVPTLKSMDARSVSARKLMLRVCVSIWGRAMENSTAKIAAAGEIPEDVQLLQRKYPMELAAECGEKQVNVEEELTLPDTYPQVEKLLRQQICLDVTEQKVMASRLVMKGAAKLQILYLSGGKVCSWKTEIPVAVYADLERDHSASATAQILPVLTNLDIDVSDGRMTVKAGFAVQYVIFDRVMAELIEDAYSTVRSVSPQFEELLLPAVLERKQTGFTSSQNLKADTKNVVDIFTVMDHPVLRSNADGRYMYVCGQHQVLYEDVQGNLQNGVVRFEESIPWDADQGTAVQAVCVPGGSAQAVQTGDGLQVSQEHSMKIAVTAGKPMTMVTGLELGQPEEADPGRPSMIVQRCGNRTLWELAKECGSTVEAISRVNGLDGEPEWDKMLLIPVC